MVVKEARLNDDVISKIKIGDSLYAQISGIDYQMLSTFKWRSNKSGRMFYATTKLRGKTLLMHRLILSCEEGQEVDHIDGDGLNNARFNLRICTRAENQQNRGIFKNNKSGYCGVYYDIRKKKPWRAEINSNHRRYFLGYFGTPKEAAVSYNEAATKLHKGFAKLNVI